MANKSDVIVVKVGGATLGSHDTAIDDLVSLQQQDRPLVVVHGGGKLITEWLARQGIDTRFVRGERVTDRATLEVVTAVLAGVVNKQLVAAINGRGGRAVGISGVDGVVMRGRAKSRELGYVGEVAAVDTSLLQALLQSGYIPVIAPIAIMDGAKSGELLNINADVAAGEIAAAIGATRLIFLTDIVGVCDRDGKLLPRLSPEAARGLVASGVAAAGMIPKINASLHAVAAAATASIIDGRKPGALNQEIAEGNQGTTIEPV